MAYSSPTRVGKSFRKLLVGVTAVALLATGCGNGGDEAEVSIEYNQVGYFGSYEAQPGSPSTPGANGGYILYRINSIENNSGNAFTVNPNRLVAEHDNDSREHAAHEAELLGDNALEAVSVEDGETSEDLGCVIMVARVDNAEETFGNFGGTVTRVDLTYQQPGNNPVVETTREEGNTGFQIIDPANPETIQSACEGED
ncbi:MAG TPA: hypothetical protein VHJ78_04965 [Actinomycetota bacterium]|nr:hypothetical protein [Actinomycetota bacterium]